MIYELLHEAGEFRAGRAGRALRRRTGLEAADICRESLQIAGEICIYTNLNLTVLEIETGGGAPHADPAD